MINLLNAGSLSISVLCVSGSMVAAHSAIIEWDLQNYIREYLNNSQTIEQSRLNNASSQEDLRAAENPSETNLSLSPNVRRANRLLEESMIRTVDDTFNLDATLSQTFPSATRLSLMGTRALTLNTTQSEPAGFWQYSLRIDQPLWRNSFGRQTRLNESIQRENLKIASLTDEDTQANECMKGTLLFLEAYAETQKEAIYAEISQAAEKLFATTRKSYKRKLIGELDLLSAESDHLRTVSLLNRSRQTLANAFARLTEPLEANLPERPILKDPTEKMASLTAPSSIREVENNPGLRSKIEEEDRNLLSLDLARDRARNSVDFFAEGGQSRTRSVGLEPLRETFFVLGLQLDLPLVRSTNSRDTEKAINAHASSILGIQRERERLRELFRIETEQHNFSREELKISISKLQISEKQVQRSLRDLRIGKIEFEDYLRLRDRYLNERLAFWDLTLTYWRSKLNLFQLVNRTSQVCGDFRI